MKRLKKLRTRALGMDPSLVVSSLKALEERLKIIDERLLDLAPFIVEADALCKDLHLSLDSKLSLAKAEFEAERETIDVLQEIIHRDIKRLMLVLESRQTE